VFADRKAESSTLGCTNPGETRLRPLRRAVSRALMVRFRVPSQPKVELQLTFITGCGLSMHNKANEPKVYIGGLNNSLGVEWERSGFCNHGARWEWNVYPVVSLGMSESLRCSRLQVEVVDLM
jgi:hypothetical protein